MQPFLLNLLGTSAGLGSAVLTSKHLTTRVNGHTLEDRPLGGRGSIRLVLTKGIRQGTGEEF